MMPPNNGIYIIQGEINLVLTAMRRNTRWGSHSHQDHDNDPLLGSFSQLKDVLNNITDLDELDPNVFLGPFLDVIRSEDTTGPVTGLALTSVNKFLSYGLIDPGHDSSSAAIENIADAVTHARFVGTDPSSDEVVLLKILHVLRTMLLCPAGVQLTNESVCEIMQSCFRICFEMRLSELLRKSAEHTLMDMVQLLFTRLPQFKEDPKWSANMRKLKMRAGTVDVAKVGKKKRSPKPKPKKSKGNQQQQPQIPEEPKLERPANPRPDTLPCDQSSSEAAPFEEINQETIDSTLNSDVIATTPVCAGQSGIIDIAKGFQQEASDREEETRPKSDEQQLNVDESDSTTQDTSESALPVDAPDESAGLVLENGESSGPPVSLTVPGDEVLRRAPSDADLSCASADDTESLHSDLGSSHDSDYISSRGVRFTAQNHHFREGGVPLIPYGLPCVRELFRFLTSLMNPLDRHNTDVMIHMGLSLLTVALESGADHISQFNSLLYLVKDEMCKNLFMLLMSERLSLFAASIRVCFLLFESMRSHLKFQLEMYFTKLSDIIVSDSPRISYEMREIALESIVQLWRIPGLVTECYLNYDCDLYCSNTFDDLTKLLSKNAFPVSGLFSTHLLSLDALLTVVDSIEQHCHSRVLNSTKYLNKEDKDVNIAEEVPMTEPQITNENSSGENECLGPPTTGYCVGQSLLQNGASCNELPKAKMRESKKGPQIKPNRMKISGRIPSLKEIAAIKHKKKIYSQGADQFNMKPSKGIQFLQENGLLSTPLDPGEVVMFLKEYPKLDKQMIGEYISNKKNSVILEAFVKSFNFCELRIDESLRQYLETFRLPGEAPVISYLMEHFADHWHKSNGEPFANVDAAFTLAYAVIMLNVDQHNHNVKKQSTPMTVEDFKRNLKKVNGGQDFEEDMIIEIYNTIRSEEIVMPDEHGGLVKENYLWKVLLKRGTTKEGVFIHAPTGSFDHELFTLIWGQTVAALSFVFDKSSDETIIQKAVSGFRKCAMISAHYGMSDVFDNLVISLCKFTTLLSSAESPEIIPISFGGNFKAQLAARTVFGLAHRHGDILRDGWKNILDCMLQLYRAKLLPKPLTEVEDFIDSTGKISILKEENPQNQRSDTGVLSSLYSYFSISESANQKMPTPEEQEASKQAQSCIRDCHIDHLVQETKFLREDSLQELIKALIVASEGPEVQTNVEGQYDEDAAVFFLELLIKVVLQNRDRVTPIWQAVRDHLYNLMVNAIEHTFLAERAVVGLLRLAIRLLRRDEISSQVLTSLRILLLMKPNVIHRDSRQIAFGLHDLLRTNAANIHSSQDWYTLFTILEVVGAGTNPPPLMQSGSDVNVQECLCDAGAQSDSELQESLPSDYSDRVYSSDSELYETSSRVSGQSTEFELRAIPDNGSWLMVNKDDKKSFPKLPPSNQYTIELNERLCHTDTKALLKSSELLSFLVRDAAHVTPHNFESCVHAIRLFVEASLNGGQQKTQSKVQCIKERKNQRSKHRRDNHRMKKSTSSPSRISELGANSDEEVEADGTIAGLQALSIQLLDLMHTLHTRAAAIFSSWAEEGQSREDSEGIDAGTSTLWLKCWCPLLQGIARLCCDVRRQVRSQALTYLQRALLVHDLQTLSAAEWEACFNKVMFPLLTNLLENINPQDPSGMEETRMRASTLLCKVFLQHLSPLLSLSTFTALWLTILDFMDKYMHADSSDLLNEAIPESLKNMLLVMNTASIFQTLDGTESQLWKLSWDRIDTFLPNLRDEVFKSHEPAAKKMVRNCEVPENSSMTETPEGASQDLPASSSPVVPHTLPPETDDVQLEGITIVKDKDMVTGSTNNAEQLTNTSTPPVSSCILHPPLPTVTTPSVTSTSVTLASSSNAYTSTTVPLLLNPDIIQGTAIPYISPQSSPQRQPNMATETQ